MARSVSQGGQRLLGWGKTPGQGSQKNGTFRVLTRPNGRKLGACRIQFAGKASALLGRRADIICRTTSPKLAPRSNSFAPASTDIRANLGKGLFGWAE